MDFDLPAILGEYLLPLLILLPLAIVVMLIAARSQKDDHWSHSRQDPLPRDYAPAPKVAAPPPAPTPVSGAAVDVPLDAPVEAPAPRDPTTLIVTPFQSPMADAVPPAARLREAGTTPLSAPTPPTGERRRRASDIAPGPAAPSSGPVPVLIVDDSAVVRAKLSKLLSGAGYAVTMARHGQDALEQLNQHWFSMMITDLEMPEMDGFELIQHVSGDIRTENLPIVAITGHEELGARVADVKGLYGIFKKPWNDRELLARVGVLTQLRPRV